MTAEAINEAVAKGLGWAKDGQMGWVRPGQTSHQELPNFCGDIGAAWAIVEKITARETFFLSFASDLNDPLKRVWCCVMSNIGLEDKGASTAICLAFLKLKGLNP